MGWRRVESGGRGSRGRGRVMLPGGGGRMRRGWWSVMRVKRWWRRRMMVRVEGRVEGRVRVMRRRRRRQQRECLLMVSDFLLRHLDDGRDYCGCCCCCCCCCCSTELESSGAFLPENRGSRQIDRSESDALLAAAIIGTTDNKSKHNPP